MSLRLPRLYESSRLPQSRTQSIEILKIILIGSIGTKQQYKYEADRSSITEDHEKKILKSMGCCRPSTCCTCIDESTKVDDCMCGCAYLNGPLAIFVGQFFTLVGGLLSVGSMIDCSFATIDPYTFDLNDGLEIESMGVGFIFFQKSDGHCYWYNDASDTENQLETYWNLLGYQWVIASGLACFCSVFSWFFFWYSASFCCSSQVRPVRCMIGFMVAGVLTVCQACTFIVYGQDFCHFNDCTFSRGSGTSIGAMLCYIVGGLGFFLSSDYPGIPKLMTYSESDDEQHAEGGY